MINVKRRKKERKKSVWIGEIFLPDLFRFCGQKRPEKSLDFFLFLDNNKNREKMTLF